jgi:hypothetical protein
VTPEERKQATQINATPKSIKNAARTAILWVQRLANWQSFMMEVHRHQLPLLEEICRFLPSWYMER